MTIDRLWVKYSNGIYGFSVQKKLYIECGAPLDTKYNEGIFQEFGRRLGWYRDNNWWEPSCPPYQTGCFPFCIVQSDGLIAGGSFCGLLSPFAINSVLDLLTRVEVCGL